MDLARTIELLSEPAAYPTAVESVEVRQTHISVVFLTDQHVYKIKKPVNLGFVDFSTLALRRHFCDEEVRLNARLAAEVYLGVVPIVASGGALQFEQPGEAVEWAVKMKRLPDEATLESRFRRGAVTGELIEALARKIADFHARAETNERIAGFGRFEVVARNARENFEQSQPHVGQTISRAVFERLQARTEQVLADNLELVESRAARGVPRDAHGDLRLDHVYVFDQPDDPKMLIIDCIEFNEQFRFGDPVSDMAFLAMDLKYEGRRDLAGRLADAYIAASHDAEGRRLLAMYTSYRAAVRGKVEGFRQAESEVPDADRAESRMRGRGYWLLALGELEPPEKKPALVLIGGLPGSGKSTLAAQLAGRGSFDVIRSDAVRKSLAGVAETGTGGGAFGTGIYSSAWDQRTYDECLRQAETLLFEGRRVVVDASFREEAKRRAFLDAAARWKVPTKLLVCQADAEVIRARLASRSGDVSDADWAVYLRAAQAWEQPSAETQSATAVISTGGTSAQAVDEATAVLRSIQLAG